MRFSIDNTIQNGLDLLILQDGRTGTEVSVLPAFGALLHDFSVRAEGTLRNCIDNYTGHEELQEELSLSFKGSKLSPFPCRIPEGKYRFNHAEYEFKTKFIDGSAIHGLLYNKTFSLINAKTNDQSASIMLQYEYNQDDPGYPFNYRCQVEYVLLEGALLKIRTTLFNPGEELIPVADGWHPYFILGGKIDNWLLSFEAESLVEFDERLIPTGNLTSYRIFEHPLPIGDTFLDNCFLLKPARNGPVCRLTNPASQLSLTVFADENYPYLQIYTPPHRNSIAIENLSGAPDCFNNQMGLHLLRPGDSQSFTLSYALHAL